MIAGYFAELGIYEQITEGLRLVEFILGRKILQWTDGEKEIIRSFTRTMRLNTRSMSVIMKVGSKLSNCI